MIIRKFKNYFTCSAAESGRTMAEVMAVLAIAGILSVAGFWLFRSNNRERVLNDIIYNINMQVAQIYPALQQNGPFASKKQLDNFLAPYTKQVGDYVLTFQSDPYADGNDFVTQVTKSNGQPIKGDMCRALITRMSKLKMAQDVSFSLKDEETEDGKLEDVMVPLNGKTVDYDSICSK